MAARTARPGAVDPWAARPATAAPSTVRWRAAVVALAAAALGSFGAIAQAWPEGSNGQRGAEGVAVYALVLAPLLWLRRRSVAALLGAVLVWFALGLVAAHATLGASALVLVTAAVVAAVAALGGGRAWVAADPPTGRVVGLAVPFVLLSQLRWLAGGSIVVALLLAGVALVVVEGVPRWPQAFGRVDRALVHGTVRLATWLAGAVMFVVALVVLYLPGAVAAVASAAGRHRRPSSTWRPRGTDLADARRDAGHPFASPSPGSRRRQLVLGFGIGLVAVALLVTGLRGRTEEPSSVLAGGTADTSEAMARPYSERPAGQPYPWIDDVQREQREQVKLVPGPVAGYRLADLRSTYTNVRGGERVSTAPEDCACPSLRVWLVGGSAVFGIGQRDTGTLASQLVREGEADGIRLEVDNMGTPGWTLWQEYQGIVAKLARGAEPPDLIVFYDGFNDMASTFVQTILGDERWDEPTVFKGGALESLGSFSNREVDAALRATGAPDEFASRAATRFEDLRALVDDLLRGQGIATAAFFQPDALAATLERGQPLPDYMFPSIEPRVLAPLVAALRQASLDIPDQGFNLRPLHAASGTQQFFDIAHMNEAATTTTAAAMYRQLRPQIISLAHR